MRVARSLRLATSLLIAASSAAIAQDSIPDGDWRTINRDAKATRFSPLADINRSNVSGLTEAWNYPFRSFTTAVPLTQVASSTRLTARAIRRHCASSSLNCRRPARVSE